MHARIPPAIRVRALAAPVLAVVAASCAFLLGDTLTQARIDAYLAAYAELAATSPDAVADLDRDVRADAPGYDRLQSIVRRHGFADFLDFSRVNAKIGLILSLAESRHFLSDPDLGIGLPGAGTDERAKELRAKLDDPALSEDERREIREALDRLGTGQAEIEGARRKGGNWAEFALRSASGLAGGMFTPEEAELVARNRDRILAALAGAMLPEADSNASKP